MEGNDEMGIILLVFLFFLLWILAYLTPLYVKFSGSKYQQASGNSFFKMFLDRGNYGEFLTFNKLERLTGHYRLMTNLYLPKKDGSTTEVDLIMLAETGLYVFESKNYSGWIFGDEKNKNWTQSLPNKHKEKFFNPVWQNKAHINALKSVLGLEDDPLFKSYIIFSERCTLKKISVTSPNVKVMKRNDLLPTIKKDIAQSQKILTPQAIDQLQAKLSNYSHADSTVKKAHIKHIKAKL